MIARARGSVVATRGGVVEARLPFARVGDGVRICARGGAIHARVTSLHGAEAALAPFGPLDGVTAGDRVEVDPAALALPLGTPLLGRAVDASGAPLDGGPRPSGRGVPALVRPVDVHRRVHSPDVFWTGVRAIDGPLAIARGARVGVFGAPGAGKSTLIDLVLRGASADAIVVALVGERGREAERRLAALDARTTIVCATADRAAAERVRAAEIAVAQAAALRDRGLDVLLVLDSLARVALAARELAVAAGETPGRGGFPPGVFATIARLIESAGALAAGSVTLIATVLGEGPDQADPVSEAARAALDGHVMLSQRLAEAGRFPAIDVPRSASRTMADAAAPEHRAAAGVLRAALAVLEETRDARSLGMAPADPFAVRCAERQAEIEAFLRQGAEPSDPAATLTELVRLADSLT